MIFRYFLLKRLNFLVSSCLKKLDQLQKKIFSIYLNGDYTERQFEYEKELHFIIFSILKVLGKISKRCKKIPESVFYVSRLNNIFEIIVSLGSLRYRVKDQAIFEVFTHELSEISNMISHAMSALSKGKVFFLDKSSIEALEEIYHRTLVVASNEPIVYLVFINNLKELMKELMRLINERSELA